jgi:SWIM zinc finger
MAPLSLQKIETIAPDQASLSAAHKLLKPALWSGLSKDGAGLVWGACQGSGASPYRVVISELDGSYKCTCPSRKFPCKHSLALMWLRADDKTAFDTGAPPEWVHEWQKRQRTGSSESTAEKQEGQGRGSKSIALTEVERTAETDPNAEARGAAARERTRKDREDAIAAGLDDLDQWLADQVESGLAGFAATAGKSCRVMAQRLVDAKASGLAARLENLPARLYALPEAIRPRIAIEELGQLHLLAEAYRRQDTLRPDLREDVRREVGWNQTRELLLADQTALRATGTWRVAGNISEIQPDRLRRLETWLWRDDAHDGQRFAVLIDFVPLAAGAARSPFITGERLAGTIVFHPSPMPMRGLIAGLTSPAEQCRDDFSFPDEGLREAFRTYERALAAKPWLGVWPMAFRNVQLRRSEGHLFVCAMDGAMAAPLIAEQADLATPLSLLESFDGIGLWNGTHLRLFMAQTKLGMWVGE